MGGWVGYKLGDKYAMLGGSSLVPKNITLKKRIRYLFERVLPLISLYMTEEKMREYARKLEEFKPKFIREYPSVFLSSQNICMKTITMI